MATLAERNIIMAVASEATRLERLRPRRSLLQFLRGIDPIWPPLPVPIKGFDTGYDITITRLDRVGMDNLQVVDFIVSKDGRCRKGGIVIDLQGDPHGSTYCIYWDD